MIVAFCAKTERIWKSFHEQLISFLYINIEWNESFPTYRPKPGCNDLNRRPSDISSSVALFALVWSRGKREKTINVDLIDNSVVNLDICLFM
jgi:hypothetical protein